MISPIYSQDYKADYKSLLTEYDTLVDSYEEVINELKDLNKTYEKEIDMHQLSKEQIEMDQTEIIMLRDDIKDLIYLVDPKYFTLYVIGGYQGGSPLGGIAISASLPKIPFAVLAGAEYIHPEGLNFKLGIGVRF
jgi:hypothetical protein